MALFGVFQVLLLVLFGQTGQAGSGTQVDLAPFLGAYTVPDIVTPKSVNEIVYLTLTIVIPTVIAACWSLWALWRRYSVVAFSLLLNCVQVALMSPWSWTGFIHYGRLSMGVPLLIIWMALEHRSRAMAVVALVQTILALALLPFIILT